MGFATFFLLAWLIIAIFIVMQKKLSISENTFVFLFMLIVVINVSWISIEELKLIHLTKRGIAYTAFLLDRSVIIPMVVLIQLNILERSNTFTKKIFTIVTAVIVMLGLSFLSNYFTITIYTKWNYGYDVIYYFFLLLLALFLFKSFRKISKNVVEFS
jgi:hypothetical protein